MKSARPRLWHIDLIRVVAFSAVIVVHSLQFTQPPASVAANGALMGLQFGREVFFALTGFVLTYAFLTAPLRPVQFWRRRILLIAVPFVAWTVVYLVANPLIFGGQITFAPLLGDLLNGGSEYHLYFLVVTFQLYLLFPLLLAFVRRTADRAWTVLGVVAALNIAWLAALQYIASSSFMWQRAYELAPTYAVWIFLGCYAAMHRERIEAFARTHGRRLLMGAVALLAVSELGYLVQLTWYEPRIAGAVLQPAMVPMCVGVLIIMGVLALRWSDRSPPGHAALRVASDISFGVYLVHPLVLNVLLAWGIGFGMEATILGIVIPAVVAAALTYAVRFTPLSLALTGRPRRIPTQLTERAEARPIVEGDDHQHVASTQASIENALAPVAS